MDSLFVQNYPCFFISFSCILIEVESILTYDSEGKKKLRTLTVAKAISLIMSKSFHGLCIWHIRHNALKHMNHLYQNSSQFGLDFKVCIDLHKEECKLLNE